jgi:glucose-6-phosphate 1-dehydrogenase
MHAVVAEHIATYVYGPFRQQKEIDLQFHFFVEKPIGVEVQSATDAITALSHAFESLDPVRFVDHYLAKERVRDIQCIAQDTTPALHEFQSMISSPTLRRIDVVLFEMVDVHGRGVFYDEVGALFDVGQNHLLQVLAEVLLARYTMMVRASEKPPRAKYADAQVTSSSIVRIPTKSEIIDHLHIVGTPVFGQYEGYVQEPEVNPESDTETYVDVSAELMNSFHQTFKPYLQGITCRIASAKKAGYNASEIILHNDTGQNATIDMREGVDAYTYLFTHILTSPHISPQLFATPTEIRSSWKFVMGVSEKKSKEQMVTYQSLPKT